MCKMWIAVLFCGFPTVYSGTWHTWGEKRYFVSSWTNTWSYANDICENSLQAKLAVIETKEENDWLKQLMQAVGTYDLWIGLRRGRVCTCENVAAEVCTACRESWTWYDGTAMNFYQWVNGEPATSRCGRLKRDGWAERGCNYGYRYLCEQHLCDTFNCGYGTCQAANSTASCTCDAGYTGTHCDADIDECDLYRYCENGATCLNTHGSYGCQCIAGWQGTHCELNINECVMNPCTNNATCMDTSGSYSCECLTGYTGVHCETDIEECSSNPCINNGTCQDLVGRFQCHCMNGFQGDTCQLAPGDSRESEETGLLKNVREEDLIISLYVGAILASISLLVFVILLVLDFKDRKKMKRSQLEDVMYYNIGTECKRSNVQ